MVSFPPEWESLSWYLSGLLTVCCSRRKFISKLIKHFSLLNFVLHADTSKTPTHVQSQRGVISCNSLPAERGKATFDSMVSAVHTCCGWGSASTSMLASKQSDCLRLGSRFWSDASIWWKNVSASHWDTWIRSPCLESNPSPLDKLQVVLKLVWPPASSFSDIGVELFLWNIIWWSARVEYW